MNKYEQQAVSVIEKETNPELLLQIAKNARGKSVIVERASILRLALVSAKQERGTVQHACWQMVYTIEGLRHLNGRKVTRMNRLRPKIDKDGEIGALEYCVKQKTAGFVEIMNLNLPELTAEAIVMRHSSNFSESTISAARARLQSEGVEVDAQGNIIGAKDIHPAVI